MLEQAAEASAAEHAAAIAAAQEALVQAQEAAAAELAAEKEAAAVRLQQEQEGRQQEVAALQEQMESAKVGCGVVGWHGRLRGAHAAALYVRCKGRFVACLLTAG